MSSRVTPSDRSAASQALEALVEAAAEGDRAAQDDLLQAYWPLIRMAVGARRRRLSPKLTARDESRDLEQDVAVKVLLGLRGHDWRGTSAFAAWVRRLAKNEVIDAARRNAAQRRDAQVEAELPREEVLAAGGRSQESVADGRRAAQALLREIERLKPEYGAALLMHHWGFSHAEIGDALECSEEAARKLVSRARTRLLALTVSQRGS